MKSINYLLFATAIATLSLTSTSCKKDGWPKCKKANGEMATEIREVSNFAKIHLTESGEVILIQDESKSAPILEIETSSNVLDRIKTEVKNNELVLSSKCIRGKNDITYTITVADLSEISISGSGNITTQNQFKLDDIRMNISGSGDIFFNTIAENVQVDISGSGNVKLNGTSSNLDIDIAGSGDVKAFDFPANDCFVSIAGSGNCQVFVNGFLDVSIAGSGDVIYDGTPTGFNSNTSGSGNVSKR